MQEYFNIEHQPLITSLLLVSDKQVLVPFTFHCHWYLVLSTLVSLFVCFLDGLALFTQFYSAFYKQTKLSLCFSLDFKNLNPSNRSHISESCKPCVVPCNMTVPVSPANQRSQLPRNTSCPADLQCPGSLDNITM